MNKTPTDKLAGILITVSIHLTVIIVLLLTVVTPNLNRQKQQYEIDFSEQEKIDKLAEQLAKAKAINEKLDRMLHEEGVSLPSYSDKRNTAVDASLKDDRGTDAEKLYKEAERIQKDFEKNMSRKDDDDYAKITKEAKEKLADKKQDNIYTGPSVLSYQLEGRKGSHLPIPAYKCIGEGEVTIIIIVAPNGKVLSAKVQEDISSTDPCLREYALKAAEQSRFSTKSDAPPRQIGNIVYSFIAQ